MIGKKVSCFQCLDLMIGRIQTAKWIKMMGFDHQKMDEGVDLTNIL